MSIPHLKALPSLNPDAAKDHHVNDPPTSFQNPWPSFNAANASGWNALQAKLSRNKPEFVPVPEDRVGLPAIVQPDFGHGKEGFKATWIGHASFLLETTCVDGQRGVRILCDPVWSQRTSPVQFLGPKRYSEPPCTLEEICENGGVDVVVISHDHYDHLDHASILEIHRRCGKNVVFLAGLGNADWFHRQGIPTEQVREMDWWDAIGVTIPGVGSVAIHCTPTQHFSGRSLFDRGKTLWCSWAFVEPSPSSKHVYFAGDTGYRSWTAESLNVEERDALPSCPAFSEIGQRLGPFDLALLPIGLCTPRTFMSNVHCNPWDTVRLHRDVRSRKSVGMHFGTVRGGISAEYEDTRLPAKWWKEASEESGIVWEQETLTINIGETIVV